MDNIVQVSDNLYLNIVEAVKIEANGQAYAISIREVNGSLSVYYCKPEAPGYAKLKQLLAKAR